MKKKKQTMTNSSDLNYEDIPKNTSSTVSRLLARLSKQKTQLFIIVICGMLSCLAFALTPIFVGVALDNIVKTIGMFNQSSNVMKMIFDALLLPVIALLILSIACGGIAYIQQYIVASVGEKLTLSLRNEISEKITKLPLRFFDSHKTGDILSRTTNDIEKISEVMQVGLMQFISSIFTILITFIAMLFINPTLTFIVLIAIVISTFATKLVAQLSQKNFSENQIMLGALNSRIEEIYTGDTVLKVFNQQRFVTDIILDLNEKQYKAMRKAQFTNYAIYPTIRILNQLGFIATALFGAIMVINGKLSLGMAQAFLQYVNQVSEPVTGAAYVINSLQSAIAGAERVFEFLDEEEEVMDSVNESIPQMSEGHVCFNHVRFGYTPEKTLMKDVNLEVKPNEMVAIVGPTGGGKTTLINLLMRFYEITGGEITIDGVNITSIPRANLRRMIGMVLQDTWLFHGTIADNIAYAKMDASREEIIEVAKAAHCDHFIRTLPEGYDTVISSETSFVSQGQMQLLTIARAMLANPIIMILDEATSSVDTRTEVEIQKAMSRIMHGKTNFVIAHRLSTIVNADLILVVRDGDIIESGTHHSLIEKNGFYSSLYNAQFS